MVKNKAFITKWSMCSPRDRVRKLSKGRLDDEKVSTGYPKEKIFCIISQKIDVEALPMRTPVFF